MMYARTTCIVCSAKGSAGRFCWLLRRSVCACARVHVCACTWLVVPVRGVVPVLYSKHTCTAPRGGPVHRIPCTCGSPLRISVRTTGRVCGVQRVSALPLHRAYHLLSYRTYHLLSYYSIPRPSALFWGFLPLWLRLGGRRP